jgi:hypothetical protein
MGVELLHGRRVVAQLAGLRAGCDPRVHTPGGPRLYYLLK